MIQMMWARYGENSRKIVAERILGKIDNNMRNLNHLNRPLYRSKKQRAESTKVDKSTWFRKEGATATLTVPETQGSSLVKRLRMAVARVSGPKGTKVKVVEQPGVPPLQGIALKNPFKSTGCSSSY